MQTKKKKKVYQIACGENYVPKSRQSQSRNALQ